MAAIRKRGVAAAVVCSDAFVPLATAQARVFGAPDLPLIVIPHPLGGLGPEDVKRRAEVALPRLIEILKEYMR